MEKTNMVKDELVVKIAKYFYLNTKGFFEVYLCKKCPVSHIKTKLPTLEDKCSVWLNVCVGI